MAVIQNREGYAGRLAIPLPGGWLWLASFLAALALAGGNVAIGRLLTGSSMIVAVAAGLVPSVVLLFDALVLSRTALFLAALSLPFVFGSFTGPWPVGGVMLSSSDLIVLLAVATWVTARLRKARSDDAPRFPSTPVLGWPLLLLSVAIVLALIRGHERYGTSLIGQPLRIVLYAGIGAAMSQTTAVRAYKAIVVIFYVGIVWTFLNALYYIATGTSQTDQSSLSTGGVRYLAGSTTGYLASGMFLAILNLQMDDLAKRRALHIAMIVLAFFGIVVGFSRNTFLAVALITPLLLLRRAVIRSAAGMLPLFLGFIALGIVLLLKYDPTIASTFVDRIQYPRSTDMSVDWRRQATAALWGQVRESPVTGVGFGRMTYIHVLTADGNRIPELIPQDAHESYLYLWSGGGAITLGAFLLVIATYFRDLRRRLKNVVRPHERVLILWAAATLGQFLVGFFFAPVLSLGVQMLLIWTVLLIPALVGAAGEPPTQIRSRDFGRR